MLILEVEYELIPLHQCLRTGVHNVYIKWVSISSWRYSNSETVTLILDKIWIYLLINYLKYLHFRESE
jgi:hypothetical protein